MIGDPVALKIRRKFKRPSTALVRAFATAQTSFITDAMQGMNAMHYSIKGLNIKQKFCGVAVTALNGPRDNLAAMAMLDFVQKGDVLVIATNQDESGAVVGDNWAAVARQRGVVGIVTDGLVRDATGCEKMGPPMFCRGLSPNAGYRNGPGEINTPVSVGGVVVFPGDIVVGDRDGVVVVPRDEAPDIKVALTAIKKAEAETEKKVKAKKLDRFWNPDQFKTRGVTYLD
jgi:4-hydroxy-4-methyl-2-oxoglutarate aldolase